MTTLLAPHPSPSGQLARPGAHLDELVEVITTSPPGASEAATPAPCDSPADEEIRAREIHWVCEWWPPT
jgi:hypothetical protein